MGMIDLIFKSSVTCTYTMTFLPWRRAWLAPLLFQSLINECEEDGGRIEFPSFNTMMARKAAEAKETEHLHCQDTFRVFTTPNTILPCLVL